MKWNKSIIFFLLILFGVGLLTSPFWLWQLKHSKELNVLIMDKTVPDSSYQEHAGLIWVLNNQKYVKSNQAPYSKERDYVGVNPLKEKHKQLTHLPKDLSSYDVIYMTDQYGVDKEEASRMNSVEKVSKQMEGGLALEDVERVESALFQNTNKTLIAEFNTFAAPTSDQAREKITNLLHLSWSGWIGRYFSDLESNEVPIWVKERYEQIYDHKWSFKGSGLILINSDDHLIVLSDQELVSGALQFSTTDKGKDLFNQPIKSNYGYWFDIVAAKDETDILATYTLPVNEKGKAVLTEYGLPSQFPAVIQYKNKQYTSYYFAGDYADEAEVPALYKTVGFDTWKRSITYRHSFYWNSYVPIMKGILKNGLHSADHASTNVETTTVNHLKINTKTDDTYIQVLKDNKWTNLLVKGVNMGIAKPGTFPGETAITKDEYLRWFKDIGAMHANAIRVYTLHPPAFYQALYEYNQLAEEPLYLFHGAWINEETLLEKQDAYANEVDNDFNRELKNMIDIIHGNASIAAAPGHASGEYTYDISKYVLGIMIGIEWDPEVVQNTNEKHKSIASYDGTYFETKDASPFESWLAQKMDETVKYEVDKYDWQHTMSFTNWVTTDLLKHRYEPDPKEDMAIVNPNHIKTTENFHAGFLASYHVYPYYPDFLNYEPAYKGYINKQGKQSNYGAYLQELREAHDMPVLIAEFGVPASRGKTHENVNGMTQGFLSEQEQGNFDKEMFQMIVDENYAGGLLFAWQDEWFKRTWNTMDYDNPDRRPYWSNLQTNEQHFGLLSFDPGKYESPIYIDGKKKDWEKLGISPLYEDRREQKGIESIYVTSDEQQVNLRIDYHQPIDLQTDTTYLLFNTIEKQGQKTIALKNKTIKSTFGVDFLVKIANEHNSQILVDSYYDSFHYHYGSILHMIKEEAYAKKKDNGVFHPIRLTLNKELELPDTKIPFQSYVTGHLLFGNGNPASKEFNSLTDISVSKDKKTIEVRIPWALLNMKDPSQKEIMADLWQKGLEESVQAKGIQIAAVMEKEEEIISSFPKLNRYNEILAADAKWYTWDEWEMPAYHERLRASYYLLKDAFSEINLGD